MLPFGEPWATVRPSSLLLLMPSPSPSLPQPRSGYCPAWRKYSCANTLLADSIAAQEFVFYQHRARRVVKDSQYLREHGHKCVYIYVCMCDCMCVCVCESVSRMMWDCVLCACVCRSKWDMRWRREGFASLAMAVHVCVFLGVGCSVE